MTGTDLTYSSSGDLTGGTITGLSYRGFDGTLLFVYADLSLAAAQFQSAANAYGTGDVAPFEALFRTQAYVATGNYGFDVLTGGNVADRIDGNWGDDTLVGHAGNDTLIGGPLTGSFSFATEVEFGFDYDIVDYSRELGTRGITVDLTKATQQVRDTHGNFDTLSGIECIIGTSRADVIRGSDTAAFEHFVGREGADVINGGGGILDSLRYERENGSVGVTVNLAAGTATDSYGDQDRISGIENIRGTLRADTFVGNASDNVFHGFAGNDTMDGGAGLDTVSYNLDQFSRDLGGFSGNRPIRAILDDDGTGIVRDGFGAVDSLTAIENIGGTEFGDRIVGNLLANTFLGGGGSDYLDGRAGNDTLLAGDGNDVLLGGVGLDALDGGRAADLLNGGLGNDTLTGDLGFDAFVFDTALGRANVDTITDFDVASDVIQLSNTVFAALAAEGVLTAAAFQVGAAAADADDRIIYNSSTGALSYDVDGTGARAAVRFAVLDADLALLNTDFLVT